MKQKSTRETTPPELMKALKKIGFDTLGERDAIMRYDEKLTRDTVSKHCSIVTNRIAPSHWDLGGDFPKLCDEQPDKVPIIRDNMEIICDMKTGRVITVSNDKDGEYILIFNALSKKEHQFELDSDLPSNFAAALSLVAANESIKAFGTAPLKNGQVDFDAIRELNEGKRGAT
jgi:hypothetical protein